MARLILDVRTAAEYANRHLEGAINLDCNAPEFATMLRFYPKDSEYIVYCNAGGRAGRTRVRMLTLGFTDVTSYGIMGASIAAGVPVVYQH